MSAYRFNVLFRTVAFMDVEKVLGVVTRATHHVRIARDFRTNGGKAYRLLFCIAFGNCFLVCVFFWCVEKPIKENHGGLWVRSNFRKTLLNPLLYCLCNTNFVDSGSGYECGSEIEYTLFAKASGESENRFAFFRRDFLRIPHPGNEVPVKIHGYERSTHRNRASEWASTGFIDTHNIYDSLFHSSTIQ